MPHIVHEKYLSSQRGVSSTAGSEAISLGDLRLDGPLGVG